MDLSYSLEISLIHGVVLVLVHLENLLSLGGQNEVIFFWLNHIIHLMSCATGDMGSHLLLSVIEALCCKFSKPFISQYFTILFCTEDIL